MWSIVLYYDVVSWQMVVYSDWQWTLGQLLWRKIKAHLNYLNVFTYSRGKALHNLAVILNRILLLSFTCINYVIQYIIHCIIHSLFIYWPTHHTHLSQISLCISNLEIFVGYVYAQNCYFYSGLQTHLSEPALAPTGAFLFVTHMSTLSSLISLIQFVNK